VQEILNGTKQNASAAKAMSEKLDRILKHMDQEDAQPLVGLKLLAQKVRALLVLTSQLSSAVTSCGR